MTARGSRGWSLAISVLVTLLAVAGAITLVVRLPDTPCARPCWSVRQRPAARGGPCTGDRRAQYIPIHSLAPASPGEAATGPQHPVPQPGLPSASQPRSAGTAVPAGLSAAAQQVLALINQARAQAGLAAYTVSPGLDTSAARHTDVMAAGCGLSHQCPGEPALGARETAAGVHWTAAKIGEGGPVAGSTAAITEMAVGLTQSMLDEKTARRDGHD